MNMRLSIAFSALLCAGAAFGLSAVPALADEEVPTGTDWKALLVGAIEENGCKMTEEEAAVLLPPLGFGQDWTVIVLYELIEENRVAFDEELGTVTALTEVCL